MPGSPDDNVTNRYHTFQSYKTQVRDASVRPGVTAEFVHGLLTRVDSLIKKIEITVNRPDEAATPVSKEPNKVGISTLKGCVSRMDEQLQENPDISPKI